MFTLYTVCFQTCTEATAASVTCGLPDTCTLHSFSPPRPQTGCNPASAFASFSKRLASPPREDDMSRSVAGLMSGPTDTLASSIPTFPRSLSPTTYSPPASPLEGDVVIPCEFCGIALEEAVVFHHQVCNTVEFKILVVTVREHR